MGRPIFDVGPEFCKRAPRVVLQCARHFASNRMKIFVPFNRKDKEALLIYLGIAALCAFFFAIGILITCIPPQSYAAGAAGAAGAADGAGTGFAVRVLGAGSAETAERLRAALGAQLKVPAAVESALDPEGHVVRVGPLATREAADDLAAELRQAGYDALEIVPGR